MMNENEKNHPALDLAAQAARIERDLSAIRHAMRRPLEAEVAEGTLTVPQMALLHVVVHHDGISLKELSRELSLAHSTVSGIVDRLEKRGMLERRADPADGRVSRIYPTAPVTQFIEQQIPVLARGPLQAALRQATVEDRALIEQAMQRLRELLEQL